ncbi:hypothetical protein ISG33_11130 [Glaciecola sp. MH2013]|uniref:hypothetical protein n=1 Tax=Glaciecola sp. MH2013 TaxID=2785524 RepID=UPI00189D37EC|nr:hypothetical protein [Glaciecola sp. MH2013]MBF7073952.1 hypothetical protein [Glaciecola sp. MH2013]
MDILKRQLFYLVTKKIAMKINQFGCTTISSYLDEGWSNSEIVFEEMLLPLLEKSHRIALVGYRSDWREGYKNEDLPFWSELFDSLVYREGRRFFLKNSSESMKKLFTYWQEPYFLVDSNSNPGKQTIRPAIPVVEIDYSNIDISRLMKGSEIFSELSNPWAGGYYSAKKWVYSQMPESKNLFLPYRNLSSIRFFGCESTIGKFVDRVVIEGNLIEEIDEHCPGYWEDEFQINDGESLENAAMRLFEEEMN